MKLISKKEVQALRSRAIDRDNLEKSKVDEALSRSIHAFNEWKDKRKDEEYKIEKDFQNKINLYNLQIDDLVAELSKLKQEREFQMTPINKILKEAQEKLSEANKKKEECDKFCREAEQIRQKNEEFNKDLTKKEQLLDKRERLLDKNYHKLDREQDSIKIERERLFKEKVAFDNYKEQENEKFTDREHQIKLQADEIKAQISVNKEQKKRNLQEQAKNMSDRQAVNTAWDELKKLKEKYDRC